MPFGMAFHLSGLGLSICMQREKAITSAAPSDCSIVIFFFFLSCLYTQCGALTHDPSEDLHTLPTELARCTCSIVFF